MPEPLLQNIALPRIGVFSESQLPSSDVFSSLLCPLWNATSLAQADMLLLSQPVDIVLFLLNQSQPNFLKWIQSISSKPSLLIIVLADEVSAAIGEDWLNAGAERFLTHPLNNEFLLANIRKAYRLCRTLMRPTYKLSQTILVVAGDLIASNGNSQHLQDYPWRLRSWKCVYCRFSCQLKVILSPGIS